MQLPSINSAYNKINGAIGKNLRFAFFSAAGLGLAVHLFFFTNLLLNHETSAFLYRELDLTGQGRWSLQFALLPTGYVMAPWLRGVFCLLYLALTSAVLTWLFGLTRRVSILLVSAILVSFPAIGSTFTYLYLADGFMLGLLLSALAVLFTIRWKWGFLPGALALAVSMGCYQSYLSFTVLLVLLLLIQKAMCSMQTAKSLGGFALRSAGMGVLGYALYMGLLNLRLALGGITLSGYQNIDKLAGSPLDMLRSILQSLPGTWPTFFKTVTDLPGFGSPVRQVFLIAVFLLAGGLLAAGLITTKSYKSPWRLAFIAGGLVLIPVGACIITLLQPEAFHLLMRQPYCLLFMMPAIALDRLPAKPPALNLAQWAALLASLALCLQFTITTNIAYTQLQLRMEKNYSVTVRMVDRIEQTEGYAPDLPILIVGRYSEPTYQRGSLFESHLTGFAGAETNYLLSSQVYFTHYLRDYHFFTNPEADAATADALLESAAVKQMPAFPAAGSVQIIDDVIVVMLLQTE